MALVPTEEAEIKIELNMITRAGSLSAPGLDWLKIQVMQLASMMRAH